MLLDLAVAARLLGISRAKLYDGPIKGGELVDGAHRFAAAGAAVGGGRLRGVAGGSGLVTGRRAAAGRSTIYRQADGSWRGEVSLGVDPENVVARKVRELEHERDAGVRRTKTRTVTTWLEEWIAGRELVVRPSTVRGYRSDLPHVLRTLGRTRIERLTAEQVEAMYRDCLAHGLSAGTIRHIQRTLSAAVRTAVDRGYLLRDPVAFRRSRLALPVWL